MRLARIAGIVGAMLCALPVHAEVLNQEQADQLRYSSDAFQDSEALRYGEELGLAKHWASYCLLRSRMEVQQTKVSPPNMATVDWAGILDRRLLQGIADTRDDYIISASMLCLANAKNALEAAKAHVAE